MKSSVRLAVHLLVSLLLFYPRSIDQQLISSSFSPLVSVLYSIEGRVKIFFLFSPFSSTRLQTSISAIDFPGDLDLTVDPLLCVLY